MKLIPLEIEIRENLNGVVKLISSDLVKLGLLIARLWKCSSTFFFLFVWPTTRSIVIDLPIVHTDPNSRHQPRQPIVIPGVVRVLAIATYLISVVVESRLIHEYTTKLNVDNLWWNLCFTILNGSRPQRFLGTHGEKGSWDNEIFLHLNPFVLSLLLRNQQLLSFETF